MSAADALALAGHAEHALAPADENCPSGQGAQLVAPVTTLEALPCGHGAQPTTRPPALYVPAVLHVVLTPPRQAAPGGHGSAGAVVLGAQ